MLRINASEKFELWADQQLTSPSPEEILIALENLEELQGFDINTDERDEFYLLLAE